MKEIIFNLTKLISVFAIVFAIVGCSSNKKPNTDVNEVVPSNPSDNVEIEEPIEVPSEDEETPIVKDETLEEHIRKHLKVHSTPLEFVSMPPLEDLIIRNIIYFGYDGSYEITKIVLHVSYYDSSFHKLMDKYTSEDYIEVIATGTNEVLNMVGFSNDLAAFAAPDVISVEVADGRVVNFK